MLARFVALVLANTTAAIMQASRITISIIIGYYSIPPPWVQPKEEEGWDGRE